MADELDPSTVLAEILDEHGPLAEDDVLRRLLAAGVVDPEDTFEEVIDEVGCAAGQLIDGRWIWLPSVLTGRVLTHRASAHELAHDMLAVTPDLDPLTWLCDDDEYTRFTDGSPVRIALPGFDREELDERGIPDDVVHPAGALLLAAGTLASLGLAEGDLVGLRLTAQGFAIEPVTATADTELGARLSDMLDADRPAFFNTVVWQACADEPDLFTEPLPPLIEIAGHAGLSYEDEWLAPAGFDYDLWRFEQRSARLVQQYDIDPDEAFAVNALTKLYDQMSLLIASAGEDEPHDAPLTAGEDMPDLGALTGELGAFLADPVVAAILVTETVGNRTGGPAALGLLAEVLEPKVPRAARVACRWLRATALERIGNVEDAEQELLAAESMNTDWAPVLFDLARFASDRGDAERGLSLLRRAGAAPDHPMVALLEQHRAQPAPNLGRNDVCWCGSGRKYKKCHLGRDELPLAERANWLYTKAAQHVVMSGWAALLDDVGLERTRYAEDDDVDAADPLVIDAVLFEGGAFADFLHVRGVLLPDDERALAEQWLLTERTVYEVEEVRRGEGITVRDVRTGDRHQIQERTGSRFVKPGQLICARAVPVGDTMQFFGGMEPVALHQRDALIALLDVEPDPAELVAHLSQRFAPPTLVNTEGDPLAMCEATLRVIDPHKMEAALDGIYDRLDDAGPPQWIEHVKAQGMQRVRSTLVLAGDTLQVHTNSEERMDRVLEALGRVDPAMTVLDDTREPIRDTREAAALAKQLPGGGGGAALDPDDPEVAAFLTEMIHNYETSWLDEPIPALDGHTPRQAADDPTRRADLIRLLDTFPAGEAARGGMDADRLRAALEIEGPQR